MKNRILFSLLIAAAVNAADVGLANAQLTEPLIEPLTEPLLDPVVEVRVFWRVRVSSADIANSSPQFITVVSEDSTVEKQHGVFEVNHSTAPEYTPGGLQRQNWDFDRLTSYSGQSSPGVSISGEGDDIEFCHCMYFHVSTNAETGVQTRYLMFGVKNFRSKTWGEFAGLGATGHVTQLTSLDGFDVRTCAKESGIVKGNNRVEYMFIDKVEFVHASGKVTGDSTDYYIKDLNEPLTVDTTLAPLTVDKQTAY